MKTKIEIKSVFGNLLFEFEKENNTIKETLLQAIKIGADLRYANLRDANLSGANLRDANLRYANLRDADLIGADLSGANLSGANLRDANLRDANLRDANLRYANLRDADLIGADLSGANLIGANLSGANLIGADLRDADLSDANLSDANLRCAVHNESTSFLLNQCPSEGSFIGWKKADNLIIKLLITDKAKRSSSTSLKCRCSEVKVLEIQNMDGSISDKKEICSNYDNSFFYKTGEISSVDNFDNNRWNECSTGIHFFISREMAVKY